MLFVVLYLKVKVLMNDLVYVHTAMESCYSDLALKFRMLHSKYYYQPRDFEHEQVSLCIAVVLFMMLLSCWQFYYNFMHYSNGGCRSILVLQLTTFCVSVSLRVSVLQKTCLSLSILYLPNFNNQIHLTSATKSFVKFLKSFYVSLKQIFH